MQAYSNDFSASLQDVTIIGRDQERGVTFTCQRYAGSALCALVALFAFLRYDCPYCTTSQKLKYMHYIIRVIRLFEGSGCGLFTFTATILVKLLTTLYVCCSIFIKIYGSEND